MNGAGFVLHDFQQAGVDALRHSYATGHRAPVLVMPTGSGKTHLIAAATAGARTKGRRVLVGVHRHELMCQASTKLIAAGLSPGVIGPGFPQTDEAVQVGSIQTLARRLDRLPPFDFIVLDEAHHAVAGQWKALIDAQPQAWLLGVTATPQRLDGRGLGISCGGPFDDLIVGPSVAELIRDGYLVNARTFAPVTGPDLRGVRTRGGDYDPVALAQAMDRPALVGDAVEHYSKLAPGLPAIAFCVSVQHAQDVAAAFQAAGWRAVAVHGAMHAAERDAALCGLAMGAVQVLCAADLLSEGVDIPVVGAVLLLRPTQSLALHLQQVGRGLRPAPGKQTLVVMDHSGNSLRHGLIDAPRRWSLAGRPKRERNAAPAVRRCTHCGLVQSGRRSCPHCGYAAPRPTAPKTMAGTLTELRRLAPAMSYREIANGEFSEGELRAIARARGYRRGWVRHRLQAQQKRNNGGGGDEHQRP